MALIKLTAFLDSISGKVNGSVFSRNKGGAYVRGKGVVSNPQSSAQSGVRAVFGAISQAWRGLTEMQREAWNAATVNFPYQNRLGDLKQLSGFALHQKLNSNLSTIALPFIANPPQPQEVAAVTSLDLGVDVTTSPATMTVKGTFTDASSVSGKVVLFATPNLSPGVSNFNNELRLIGVYNIAAMVSGEDVYDDYSPIFGEPIEGSKIGFKAFVIDVNTGQSSAELKDATIAFKS